MAIFDGSIVRAHQDIMNIGSQADQAIGKSPGGKSTKIHLAIDSQAFLVLIDLLVMFN